MRYHPALLLLMPSIMLAGLLTGCQTAPANYNARTNKYLEQQIQQKLDAARDERLNALKKFNGVLSPPIYPGKSSRELMAKQTAQELAGGESLVKIIYYGVLDEMPTQSGNLYKYLSSIIDKNTGNTIKTQEAIIGSAKKQLDEDLTRSITVLIEELSTISQGAPVPVDSSELQKLLIDSAKIYTNATAVIVTTRTIGAMLAPKAKDLIYVKFGPLIKRTARTFPGLVVDGPFPIGDVIFFVGGLITAAELRWVANEFESDVYKFINIELDKRTAELIANAEEYSANLSREIERNSVVLAEKAFQKMTGDAQLQSENR